MKLRRHVAVAKSRAWYLLTNPALGRGTTRRAAGIESGASLVNTKPVPSLSITGEGSIRSGYLKKHRSGTGGVFAAARREGEHRRPAKPSWPRGERPRRKVGLATELK